MTTKIQPSPAQKLVTSAPTLLEKLSDSDLYERAKLYGKNALEWRRKFTGLLSEVQRRKLYEKKGFTSIFEFAFKLAGLSSEQVRTALNLSTSFSDKPALKSLLENGDVSVNKLVRIQSIATSENDSELAQIVKTLPRGALETFVRDERAFTNDFKNANGLSKPLFELSRLHVQPGFQLSGEVVEELNRLNEQGQDVNAILLELLKQRNEKIQEKKEEIAEKVLAKGAATSHHIPAAVESILKEEFGGKCSKFGCKKPAAEFHHTQRFSVSKNHDPRYIAPLCKEHHQLAHLADLKYKKMSRARS